jgi:hypothetical protein
MSRKKPFKGFSEILDEILEFKKSFRKFHPDFPKKFLKVFFLGHPVNLGKPTIILFQR